MTLAEELLGSSSLTSWYEAWAHFALALLTTSCKSSVFNLSPISATLAELLHSLSPINTPIIHRGKISLNTVVIFKPGEVSIFFNLFLGIQFLCSSLCSTSVTAAFSIQLRGKLCVQEESGLPSRRTAHIARTPMPAARSATCSRMLHLKVQFLDDSQKIFVVDVSGYCVLIGFCAS